MNRWVVLVVTSGLFSLAHLELLRTPLLLVLPIPIGLARMSTGSLIGAIVAHQVGNILPALCCCWLGPNSSPGSDLNAPRSSACG
ncbi:CPBP family glutamic-type intramembrane protease [Lentzea sp. E54]|uniref:CPBP family glutamic-type intramembrane protease n=1 Tax=Lentzea xerophila TaxID=3435883 RepID=UPI003DA58DDF